MRVQFFETLWEQFRERLLSLLSVGNDFQSISVPKELSTVPIPFPWNNTFVTQVSDLDFKPFEHTL